MHATRSLLTDDYVGGAMNRLSNEITREIFNNTNLEMRIIFVFVLFHVKDYIANKKYQQNLFQLIER